MFFKRFLGTEYNLAGGDEAPEFSFETTRTALLYHPDTMVSSAPLLWVQWQLLWPEKLALAFLGKKNLGREGKGLGSQSLGRGIIWGSSQAQTRNRCLLL